MNTLSQRIAQELLPVVRTPAQYIGGEVNQIAKDPHDDDVTVALAFPDTYAVGMSHLGTAILYEAVNRLDRARAERVFCPWTDAVEIMRERDLPLFSWETRTPLRQFDILGFTLQHELTYSNILLMLDLAGIPFRAEHRADDDPLVIAGGPIADSCECAADFFDAVILGDGEEALPAVIEAYRTLRGQASRRDILLELARRFPFVYVPRFYECSYNPDGTLAATTPTESGVPACVQRAVVEDLDQAPFPTAPLVAHTETVHDRIAIEIMRGCPGRCAFCHAGHTKGKLRTRSIERICDIAWQSYRATGHDTVSLLSLSTSDYPQLRTLLEQTYQRFEGCHVSVSLPSLRVDKQLREVPAQITGSRREGLTVAVEAASPLMRRAIGKRITDADLMATMRAAFEAGWRTVKLYFMVGFPHETKADIGGIFDLAVAISRLRQEVAKGPALVNATVSWLVPKPHTPFAWISQQDRAYFDAARRQLIEAKRTVKGASVKFKFHHLESSLLEGVFSRGDRRLAAVLEHAYKNGACFDAWTENFSYQRYLDAFAACNLDPAFYAQRPRTENEALPWDHLAGSNKPHLHKRLQTIQKLLTESPPGE